MPSFHPSPSHKKVFLPFDFKRDTSVFGSFSDFLIQSDREKRLLPKREKGWRRDSPLFLDDEEGGGLALVFLKERRGEGLV